MDILDKAGRQLCGFLDKLSVFLAKLTEAPALMWRQTADEPGNRLMLAVFALAAAAAVLYLIWHFIKAPWREKLRTLGSLLFAALIVLVILYFAL